MIYDEQELENVLKYPRPRLTVDMVIIDPKDSTILVQKRDLPEPEKYQGKWALPGGHVEKGENYMKAAERELKEEMGVDVPARALALSEVYTTTHTDSGEEIDPRGWRVTIAVYYSLGMNDKPQVVVDGEETTEYRWMTIAEATASEDALAFNHVEIIRDVMPRFQFELMALNPLGLLRQDLERLL